MKSKLYKTINAFISSFLPKEDKTPIIKRPIPKFIYKNIDNENKRRIVLEKARSSINQFSY